jgi:hypothetical protein
MNQLVIIYAKAVDDKELGVYIEGVYFGGIADNHSQANKIAKQCVNNTRGGSAIPKILPITEPKSLIGIFATAKDRFTKIERDMIENESIIEANQERAKRKKK